MRSAAKILTPVIVCLMMVSIMRNNLLYVVFECDRDLFIAMFCENTDRPELKCNGQCAMAKIQKEQQEEKAANMLKQLQTETLVFQYCKSPDLAHKLPFTPKKVFGSVYNNLYHFLHSGQINKPPQAV